MRMWMCLLFPLLASTYNTHDGMKGRHCQCLVGISMICVTGWYVMGDGMGWDGGMPNMGWGIDRSGMGSPVQHDRAVRGSVRSPHLAPVQMPNWSPLSI